MVDIEDEELIYTTKSFFDICTFRYSEPYRYPDNYSLKNVKDIEAYVGNDKIGIATVPIAVIEDSKMSCIDFVKKYFIDITYKSISGNSRQAINEILKSISSLEPLKYQYIFLMNEYIKFSKIISHSEIPINPIKNNQNAYDDDSNVQITKHIHAHMGCGIFYIVQKQSKKIIKLENELKANKKEIAKQFDEFQNQYIVQQQQIDELRELVDNLTGAIAAKSYNDILIQNKPFLSFQLHPGQWHIVYDNFLEKIKKSAEATEKNKRERCAEEARIFTEENARIEKIAIEKARVEKIATDREMTIAKVVKQVNAYKDKIAEDKAELDKMNDEDKVVEENAKLERISELDKIATQDTYDEELILSEYNVTCTDVNATNLIASKREAGIMAAELRKAKDKRRGMQNKKASSTNPETWSVEKAEKFSKLWTE